MTWVHRLVLAMVLVMGLGATAGCSNPTGTASSARQASGSANASPSELDAVVAMPAGFPADVPIFPGARLTAEAQFTSSTGTTWGMEWETHDGVDKVAAFYTSKLAQGDWNVTLSGTANGRYSASFARKSNSKFVGILGADGSSGVTKISLALGSS